MRLIQSSPAYALIILIVSVLAPFQGLAGRADAVDIHWDDAGGGNWSNAQSWNPPQVPAGPEDTATIELAGSYVVSLDVWTRASRVTISNPLATLLLGSTWMSTPDGLWNHGSIEANGTQANLGPAVVNEAGGRILIHTGSTITFGGTSVQNNGIIRVNPEQGIVPAYFNIAFDDYDGMVLDGSGTLILEGGGFPDRAEIASPGGAVWSQGPGHTVRGDGTISAPFLNEGRIVIDEPGRVLRVHGGQKTNSGVMEALAGSVLRIEGVVIDQTGGGTLRADSSTVEICPGGGVLRGRVSAPNDGRTMLLAGATSLSDVAIDGEMDILPGATVIAGHDFWTNEGTVHLNSIGSETDAVIRAYQYHTVSFNGSGTILFRTAGDPNDARLESTGETMINGPLHTMRGDGAITCPFVNHGLIEADQPGRAFRLASGSFSNDGSLVARPGSILEVATQLDQSGGGSVFADGGTVRLNPTSYIRYGSLNSANNGRITTTSGSAGFRDGANEGELDIVAGSQLFACGTLTNNGRISINSDRLPADAALCGGEYCNVTLAGTGEVVLQTAGDPSDAYLATYGWYTVNGAGHTIRGEGSIYTALTNHGVVRADAAGRALLVTGELTNDGWAGASDNGFLNVTGPFRNQQVDGLVGAAEAGPGATARFASVGTNYWGEALHGGAWRVRANGTMRLIGADIRTIAADILLEGPGSNLYRDDGAADALALLGRVAEDGRLEIRAGRTLALSGAFVNDGTVIVGTDGILSLPGEYLQHGDSIRGRTTVDGVLVASAGARIEGGTLDGTGAVQGDLSNNGVVRPGHSAGTLTVDGAFTQGSTGALVVDIAGIAPGQADRLNVTGQATLGGTLEVIAIDGFVVGPGESFTILNCASRAGEFSTVFGKCLAPGVCFDVIYYPDRVDLLARELPAADITEETLLPTELKLVPIPGGTGPARLRLDLPEAADIRLDIYDVAGRHIDRLIDGMVPAGSREVGWQRRAELRTGVYFARVVARADKSRSERTVRLWIMR